MFRIKRDKPAPQKDQEGKEPVDQDKRNLLVAARDFAILIAAMGISIDTFTSLLRSLDTENIENNINRLKEYYDDNGVPECSYNEKGEPQIPEGQTSCYDENANIHALPKGAIPAGYTADGENPQKNGEIIIRPNHWKWWHFKDSDDKMPDLWNDQKQWEEFFKYIKDTQSKA